MFLYGTPMWLYVLFIFVTIFAFWAQANVSSAFKKYSAVTSKSGKTGTQAAELILRQNGIYDVKMGNIAGSLTDNYDPSTKTIRLSEPIIDSMSVAAVGVAAHEAGHAVQDNTGYSFFRLRSAIVPLTSFLSKLSMPLVFLGIVIMAWANTGTDIGYFIANIGVLCFASAAIFQLITLPVEFNASARAMKALDESGTMDKTELQMTRKVLTAAALTYVAALAVSLVNLLRIALIVSRRNNR